MPFWSRNASKMEQKPLEKTNAMNLTDKAEVGKSGFNWSAGHLYEEFLTELQGSNGIKIYREMSDNDAVVGACLFAIKQILREAKWSAVAAGEDTQSKADAEFLHDCMHGMEHSWNDMIMDILSMISYGWSWHETVYKRDRDGHVVWRKIPIRLQSSWDQWDLDDNGNVLGMIQRPAPDFRAIWLPVSKCLLFRTELNGDNPEGKSVLRAAYRTWYFKKMAEEVEGIGMERDLAGIPVLTTPEGFDWDKDDEKVAAALTAAKNIVANLRRDEQDGVILPFGWVLTLLGSPGNRQFDTSTILDRYDKRLAMTVLAQFIMLGMERTGSYALADVQTDMFFQCLEGWMNGIRDIFNRVAVPKLFAYNGVTNRPLPYVTHTGMRKYKLKDLADYVSKLAGVEALVIDEDLQNYLKDYARLKRYREVSRNVAE
jgi:hypothetical protein